MPTAMDSFLATYGYKTASFLIRELAQRARLNEKDEPLRKELILLANNLEDALRSLEGKRL